MDNVKDIDALNGVADRAIEQVVLAMHAVPHAAVLVSGNEGEAQRHVRQSVADVPQLGDEADRSERVIAGDI